MPDPFSLLGLVRRPLIPEEMIGNAYRQKAGTLHPDQPGGDAGAFRELAEAAATLKVPSRRLRALLENPAHSSARIPPEASDLFLKVAWILQYSDRLSLQYTTSYTSLSKALLRAPAQSLLLELNSTLLQLQTWRAALDQELELLDLGWPSHDQVGVLGLADSFAYAVRWAAQLRERELALQEIFS